MQIFLAKLICANRDHELVFIAEHGNIKSGSCFLFRHPCPIINKQKTKKVLCLIEIVKKYYILLAIMPTTKFDKINFDQFSSIASLHLANMILLGLKLQVWYHGFLFWAWARAHQLQHLRLSEYSYRSENPFSGPWWWSSWVFEQLPTSTRL